MNELYGPIAAPVLVLSRQIGLTREQALNVWEFIAKEPIGIDIVSDFNTAVVALGYRHAGTLAAW